MRDCSAVGLRKVTAGIYNQSRIWEGLFCTIIHQAKQVLYEVSRTLNDVSVQTTICMKSLCTLKCCFPVQTYMHMYTYAHMHVYVYTHECIHMRTCMYTLDVVSVQMGVVWKSLCTLNAVFQYRQHMYTHTYMHMYTYTHMHVYVYTQACIRMRTCMYTYTHKHAYP
jgi:hypothetical protein